MVASVVVNCVDQGGKDLVVTRLDLVAVSQWDIGWGLVVTWVVET